MIFITVGTQLAFERLISAMDDWAGKHPEEDVFAQVGPSAEKPRFMRFSEFVAPGVADGLFREADLIVSHAGMGSILTALKYRKPIIILPRKASLGEHRNDHQLATAKWLGNRPGVNVAWDTEELIALLDKKGELAAGTQIPDFASPDFIGRLREYLGDPLGKSRPE